MILSQNELEQIRNASSLEEVRNFIFSSVENNENDITGDIVNIGILSRKEYIKYICNDTLDGSITKKNASVWNYYNGKYGSAYYEEMQYHYNPLKKGVQVNSLMGKITPYHSLEELTSDGYISARDSRTDIYTYTFEAFNDNINNKTFSNTENENVVFEFWGGYGGDITWYDYKKVEIEYQIDKTFTTSTQNVTIKKRYGGENGCYYGKVIFCCSFRPIFRYVDNRKSKDIFK